MLDYVKESNNALITIPFRLPRHGSAPLNVGMHDEAKGRFRFHYRMILSTAQSHAQTTPADNTDQPEVAAENAEGETEGEVAADLEAGEKIYKKTCKNCHDPKAKGMASFPPINGLDAEYIVAMLEVYASGETVDGTSGITRPVAEKANVAAYVATTFTVE